ncbi:hypothetical protein [Sulfurisphaera ohwakuensis]|uniref:hypothetical protein n=1 Tax=Sulfurisphaera ohwakuensis TaxID=69656 RepID=UPI0036F1F6EA
MEFVELIKKLGYDKVDINLIKRLSHLLPESNKRKAFISAYNDGKSLDDYAEEIEKVIEKIECIPECDSNSMGHDELLAYYICEKLKKKYSDINQHKYEVARDLLDSIPVLIYLHDLFKGLKMGGGIKNKEDKNALIDLLQNIFSEYDKIASIAEEAPELIYIENKEKYPITIISPLFSDIKVMFESQKTKDLDEHILKKLDLKRDEICTIISNEKWKVVAESLLLKPQRTWFSGSDIAVIAHMRGAFYAYLLFEGASLVSLTSPFFDPISLKDLLGSSAILRIFSYYLNQEIFKELRISTFFLPVSSNFDIELFNTPYLELVTPFTVYITLDSILLFLPNKIINDSYVFEKIVKEAITKTLETIFGSDSRKYSKDTVNEILEIEYNILKSGAFSDYSRNKNAEFLNYFFALSQAVEEQRVSMIEYSPLLSLSNELCDKCKTRKAIEENILNINVEYRNEIFGRKERLCHICTAVRLAGLTFRLYAKSLDELGNDLLFIVGKINPYIASDKNRAGQLVNFKNILEELIQYKKKNLIEKIENMRRQLKDNIQNLIEKNKDIAEKVSKKFNKNLEEFIKALNEEYTGNSIDELIHHIDINNEINDNLIVFYAIEYPIVSDIGALKNILIGREKSIEGSKELIEPLKEVKKLISISSKLESLPTELTIQDSIDRRLSQLIEFYLLAKEMIENLKNKKAILVPPSVFSNLFMLAINFDDFRKDAEKILNTINNISRSSYLKYEKPIIEIFLIRALSNVPVKNILQLVNSLDEKITIKRAVVYIPIYMGRGVMEIGDPISLESLKVPEELEELLEHLDKLSEENILLKERFITEIKYDQKKLSTARLLK